MAVYRRMRIFDSHPPPPCVTCIIIWKLYRRVWALYARGIFLVPIITIDCLQLSGTVLMWGTVEEEGEEEEEEAADHTDPFGDCA